MAPRRRQNRRRRNVGQKLVVPFVANVIENGTKDISLSDLNITFLENAFPIRVTSAWFTCAAVENTDNQVPTVQLGLVEPADGAVVSTSRPVLATVTQSPRASVRCPPQTDFARPSGNASVARIFVTNISSSQAIIVTVTGSVSLQFRMSSEVRPVSIV